MPEIDLTQILPVMVSYTVPYPGMETDSDGWDCIKVALRSFHEHFPDKHVLVVDNDGHGPEYAAKRAWLRAYPHAILLENPVTRSPEFWRAHDPASNHHHGDGIDRGVEYCRREGFAYMLHFEPDCRVTGRAWLEAMWDCAARGAWLAGLFPCNLSDRIIHPCPSLWAVDTPCCEPSFGRQSLLEDKQHPRFAELTQFIPRAQAWKRWDTGQKNWWVAALAEKAMWARPPVQDFQHFWNGSGFRGIRRVSARPDYEELKQYLAEDPAGPQQ